MSAAGAADRLADRDFPLEQSPRPPNFNLNGKVRALKKNHFILEITRIPRSGGRSRGRRGA